MRSITANVLLGKYTPPALTQTEQSQPTEQKQLESLEPPESFTQLHNKISAYSEKYGDNFCYEERCFKH
jgi:hypothetical protein